MSTTKKTPKQVTVVAKTIIGDDTAVLRFEVQEGGPLGFVGGQYLFFDTGLPHKEPGKTLKKAYSILSPDSNQEAFSIAVKRLADGPGSAYMNALKVGDSLKVSGPYGRLAQELPAPDEVVDEPQWPNYDKSRAKEPGFNSMKPTRLVVATDTGITAAIGLLNGARYKRYLYETQLIWVAENARDFLGIDGANRYLPHQLGEFRFFDGGSSHDAGRDADAKFYHALGQAEAQRVYLIGDGRLLSRFAAKLAEAGTAEDAMAFEYFFNRTPKS